MLVIYVPFLQNVFNTSSIDLAHWLIILPLILLPSIAAEVMKAIASRQFETSKA